MNSSSIRKISIFKHCSTIFVTFFLNFNTFYRFIIWNFLWIELKSVNYHKYGSNKNKPQLKVQLRGICRQKPLTRELRSVAFWAPRNTKLWSLSLFLLLLSHLLAWKLAYNWEGLLLASSHSIFAVVYHDGSIFTKSISKFFFKKAKVSYCCCFDCSI